MKNYTQEQILQLQDLIRQKALLNARLFKYLRSEGQPPALLALVRVPGFDDDLMCSIPPSQMDRLDKNVSSRDLQSGFRVVLHALEPNGDLIASRRMAQEILYDRLFASPDREQIYQGRVMGIITQGFFLIVEDQPAFLPREFYHPSSDGEVSIGDSIPVCLVNCIRNQRLWFRSPRDTNYLHYPFLEELEPGMVIPGTIAGTGPTCLFFRIFPGFNATASYPDAWKPVTGDQALFQLCSVSREGGQLQIRARTLCPVS